MDHHHQATPLPPPPQPARHTRTHTPRPSRRRRHTSSTSARLHRLLEALKLFDVGGTHRLARLRGSRCRQGGATARQHNPWCGAGGEWARASTRARAATCNPSPPRLCTTRPSAAAAAASSLAPNLMVRVVFRSRPTRMVWPPRVKVTSQPYARRAAQQQLERARMEQGEKDAGCIGGPGPRARMGNAWQGLG